MQHNDIGIDHPDTRSVPAEGISDVAAGCLANICLQQVDRTSPLAQRLAAKLNSLARVRPDAGRVLPSAAWRRTVAGTGLQWWVEADWELPGTATAWTPDLVIDLHGCGAVSPGRVWRVVDSAGRGALSPFIGLDSCRRAAGIVSLFLIESRDEGASWVVRCDAHLSGAQSYRSLLRGIGAAVPALIAAGFHPTSPPVAWRATTRGSLHMARLQYPILQLAKRCIGYVTNEVWAIGVLDRGPETLMAGGVISPDRWFSVPEHDGYIADPFPWPGRSNVILCERYHHRTGRGSLQALTIVGSRIVATEDVQLGVDSHLSYPGTFEEGGRVVILPEMGASRRQVMYELLGGAAPRPICVVAEDHAMADATIFRHAGLYFIAYTDTDIGLHDNLCLLWADRLEGPWTPHRGNPVKIDVRSSRSGGSLFRVADRLVRPAQDCARTYGAAIVLNHVIECTPDNYLEEPIARLVPDSSGPFPAGLHTLSFRGGTILVDGKKLVFDLGVILQRVRRNLMRPRSATTWGTIKQC